MVAPPPPGRIAGPPKDQPTPLWRHVVVVIAAGGLTVAAAILGNGHPVVTLAPCAVALVLWALWQLPLRVPMMALLAAAWVLEVPGDGFPDGLIRTPWRLVGALLFAKLNLTVPIDALVVSGFDLLVLFFGALILYRHGTRSPLDRVGWVRSPKPLSQAALISLGALLLIVAFGLARGGSFRFMLWQVSRHLYLPILVFLMTEALRGPADIPVLARIVLGAGVFRAVEAMIIRRLYPSLDQMPHATTHHDSVLFAVCVATLLAMFLERHYRRAVRLSLLLLPIYLGGIFANNRRLVWVELGFTVAFFVLVTPWGKTKRLVLRSVGLAALPVLVYVAAGWNSGGGRLFAPVRTVRSMLDGSVDSSTRWRELENYNLVETYKQRPVLGSGFGHPYDERIKMADITAHYPLEPYVPHNSVLGLWAFGGMVGFSLLWFIYPVGMFFTVRAYRFGRSRDERIAALAAAAVQICYLLQAYGDLGFGTWGPVFTLAASYAVVGKLCVASGAWPLERPVAVGQRLSA